MNWSLAVSLMLACASGWLLCLYTILIGFSGARKEAQDWVLLIAWRLGKMLHAHRWVKHKEKEKRSMSLDVSLYEEADEEKPVEEKDGERVELFWQNITHNLTQMANAAGIYEALWRPDEHNYRYAKDIIPLLEAGLERLHKAQEYFKRYDAPNGWGTYEQFVPWVARYLTACQQYPDAIIEVSR